MKEQSTLETLIQEAQQAYYKNSKPIMSDAEFDKLWDELQNKYPDSSVLLKIGNDVVSNWPKADHLLMMGSQHKATTETEIRNWVRLNNIEFPIMVQHKLDGISLEVIYNKGKLTKSITRGTGILGDLVTPNAININGIPSTIQSKDLISIRGEVCLPQHIFREKFSEDYENPRNLASGFVKKHNSVNCKYLEFIAYDTSMGDSGDMITNKGINNFLEYEGFNQPQTYFCNSIEEFIPISENVLDTRSSLNLQIDGLVLKSNKIDINDRKKDRPKKQIAWKFPATETTTTLEGVEWQISGETLTPVAQLKSVFIDGSNVAKASLVNIAEINRLDIAIGDTVVICKRNDIIPKVERVHERNERRIAIETPEECPVCGGTVEMDASTRLYCKSPLCTAKTVQRINKWIEHLDVYGFGKEMVVRLVEQEIVMEIADLYLPDFKEIALELTNLKRATEKALDELYKVKEIPLEKFIAGFNIRAFGERHTKKLIGAGFTTLQDIRNITKEEFIQIDGLGSKLYNVFSEHMESLKQEMDNVLQYINIKEVKISNVKLQGISFVITGKLHSGSRKDIQESIELLGGKVGSAVNSKTDYLVNNDKLSNSSKNKKAKELGVEIISEEQLLEMIG